MNKLLLLILSTISLLLGGCASLGIAGYSQKITVQTHPDNAHCVLKNDKGQWSIKNTPAAVKITRSHAGLLITCTKPGYQPISGIMPAQTLNKVDYVYQNIIDVTLLPLSTTR